MVSTHLPRFARILSCALPALTAFAVAAPAADAHAQRHPDPIARMAADPIARIALGSQACANANTPASRASKQAIRTAVVCLVNQQRKAHRLPMLHEQPQLDRSAQSWTNTMIAKNFLTHGADFSARISSAGYDNWVTLGENLATGISTPRQVVAAWMASPDHCRNILNPQFASVGTGVSGRPVAAYAKHGGTWAQDFGLARSQRYPSDNWGPANSCPYGGGASAAQ